jgi:hypothetical protein
MMGLELLHVISMQPTPCKVAVNPACESGSRIMDEKMVKSVVDGSALYLPTPGEVVLNGLVISLPDHQPSRLREPLRKFLGGLPEVKAAWLFHEEEPAKPHERVNVLGLMIVGGDVEEVKREATLAIAGVCQPRESSRVFLMDPKDPGLTEVMAVVPPFHAAPDFQPPAKPTDK